MEKSYKELLNDLCVSYVGKCLSNPKTIKSYNHGVLTYIIYLAPYNLSGYNVCPNAEFCHELCLNGSGHNKADIMKRGEKRSLINKARVAKTLGFFKNRESYLLAVIHEIKRYKKYADENGLRFAVRLNGTSDISPLAYRHDSVYDGKNILEIFPDIQFYDYTKVFNRVEVANKYSNYDITFSYDGHNWDKCEEYLNNDGRVAVVFENDMPKKYRGYKVIDGNESDIRFDECGGVVCGLHYHRVAANYKNGKYIGLGNTDFVVKETDENCIW